jgi:hypothetical protein
MQKHTTLTLWGIAIGWAVFWMVMHDQRPLSFPWIGLPAGLFFIVPLFVNHWIEQRKGSRTGKTETVRRTTTNPHGKKPPTLSIR